MTVCTRGIMYNSRGSAGPDGNIEEKCQEHSGGENVT